MPPFLMKHRGHSVYGFETGTGPPLLLIMGLGGSCSMWEPLLAELPGRRVIAFDSPGTGRSSTPPAALSISDLAVLARAVLAARAVSRADVLGYSYGGAVAQQLANDHPHTVRRLVLVCTNCGIGSTPPDPEAAAGLATPLRYYSPSYFTRTAQRIYGGVTGREPLVRDRLAKARSRFPPNPYGYYLQLVGGTGWTSLPYLDRLTQPTLVLSGDDDPLVPVANAQQLAQTIPRAQLCVLSGAGHLLLLDESSRAATVINMFLSTCSRPAGKLLVDPSLAGDGDPS
jgi:poly(3-hydroxyoctanoate) depolymerase